MHGDSNGGNGNGNGARITSDAALAFWGSTADLAWAKWEARSRSARCCFRPGERRSSWFAL